MKSQKEKAEFFRSLHRGRTVLVLPNAWDVPSARVFEEAGFPAVATSSAGVTVSLGYPDGQLIKKAEFVSVIGRISRALTVPLSADVVAGFGETPRQVASTVRSVVKAGAVGVNVEDFAHATKKLYPLERQVEKLKAIIEVGESMRIPVVSNARTDALRYSPGDAEAKLKEAVRSACAFKDAGADCVHPMGLGCGANLDIREGA